MRIRTIFPTESSFMIYPRIERNKRGRDSIKKIALFNKKMILYLYFSYTDNIPCYGLIINEYDITDDK